MSDPRVRVLLIEEDADDLRRARGALANIHGSTLELTTCGGTAEALDLLSRQEPELVVFGLPADGAAQRTPAERAVVELRELLAAFQGPVIVLEPGCEEELAQRLLAETLKAQGGELVLQKEAIAAWREGGAQMPEVLVMGDQSSGVPFLFNMNKVAQTAAQQNR